MGHLTHLGDGGKAAQLVEFRIGSDFPAAAGAILRQDSCARYSGSLARRAAPVDVQPAGCFSFIFGFCFGCGIRRSSSPRSGIFSSICSEMRLHTLRQRSTMAGSAVR
jgi:hypothetical protein